MHSSKSIGLLLVCSLVVAATLILGLGGGPFAMAQDDSHAAVRGSIVHIQMSGETENGIPLASEGTGFLVSNDGYILTVQHLLDPLSESVPEKIEIWVSIKEKRTSPDKQAFVVNALPLLDLLLLKIPSSVEEYTAVTLGSTTDLGSGPVYTSGFPASLDYVVGEAKIKSKDAPGGYAWVLDMATTDHGQSGSPVYDESGSVVGLIKGDLRGANPGQIIGTVFIPIERADALLLPARFDELRKLALSPARCRVCFRQGDGGSCLGHQTSCSAWSDTPDGSASEPSADKGWSGVLTVGAGGVSERCDLQWKIECE